MARDVVAAADDEARALAQAMLAAARFGALAWTDPETGTPGISRIGFGLDAAGTPLTLISALAPHEAALRASPDCALMLGEVGARGDPLTHPRLMLRLQAQFVAADDPARAALRADWLKG
ncbi:MAG: pyridoxamine 5-phosphate oxidase, partial [Cypionkella sp.]